MPILSGSALRAKQVSITVTPAKRILQQIICFSMFDSCLAMAKKRYFSLYALHQEGSRYNFPREMLGEAPSFRLAVDEATWALHSLSEEALIDSALWPKTYELDEL